MQEEFGATIPPSTRRALLDDFARSARHTRWTMINAATARARLAPTTEEALALERLGALMMQLEAQ